MYKDIFEKFSLNLKVLKMIKEELLSLIGVVIVYVGCLVLLLAPAV